MGDKRQDTRYHGEGESRLETGDWRLEAGGSGRETGDIVIYTVFLKRNY